MPHDHKQSADMTKGLHAACIRPFFASAPVVPRCAASGADVRLVGRRRHLHRGVMGNAHHLEYGGQVG